MAKTITELTAVTIPTASGDLWWVEQAGIPKKITKTQMITEVGGGGGGDWSSTGTNIQTAGSTRFDDNVELRFGTSNDVNAIFNGTNWILETSTGSEKLIQATPSGPLETYYDNIKRTSTLASGVMALYDDTSTTTERTRYELREQDGTMKGWMGYDTTTDLRIQNDIGIVELRSTSTSIRQFHAGVRRTETAAAGMFRVFAETSTTTETNALEFVEQDGTVKGVVGYVLASDNISLTNKYVSGDVLLELNGGTDIGVWCKAAGNTALYHNNVSTSRTATVATGGFEINNTQTGGGFERALTVTDGRDTGTFTPTWTGFSSAPSGSLRWQIIGDQVDGIVIISEINGNTLSGTSNANTMTITNLPSNIQPNTLVRSSMCNIRDFAFDTGLGNCTISTGGTLTFFIGDIAGGFYTMESNEFSTSGSKGLPPGWSLMYPLTLGA